jgi:hypothetical protein
MHCIAMNTVFIALQVTFLKCKLQLQLVLSKYFKEYPSALNNDN